MAMIAPVGRFRRRVNGRRVGRRKQDFHHLGVRYDDEKNRSEWLDERMRLTSVTS